MNFILFVFLLITPKSFGVLCKDILVIQKEQRVFDKQLSMVAEINPELVNRVTVTQSELKNLSSLYQILKEEAWVILPFGMLNWKQSYVLNPEVIENIKSKFSQSYNTDFKKTEHATLFYVNFLQGRYIAVSEQIKKLILEKALKGERKEVGLFLGNVYEDVIGVDLGVTNVTPERTQEVLESIDKIDSFPWQDFKLLAQNYFQKSPDSLDNWLSTQEIFKNMTEENRNFFKKNIEKEGRRKYCCKNTPGCLFCPNNRSFLRDKSS